jgi:hypothetical protein
MCGRVTVKATWAGLIVLSDDGRAAAQSAIALQRLPDRSFSASSSGPSPSPKVTRCQSACGTVRISENKIAASKPLPREIIRRHSTSSAVKGWCVHDLRRSGRSLMSRAGLKTEIAERVLSHVQGD